MDIKTFGKDYFISIKDELVVISKNPNSKLITYEDMIDVNKRYIYTVGDKILTPFGIQTIKEIIKDYSDKHGYEWLILVEENGNQYKPFELIGIVVNTMSKNDYDSFFNKF